VTYVSEVFTASIIRAMNHNPDDGGATSQKTVVFILAAVRT
jgi:hypothetical protein